VKEGIADFAISEDSDLIAYGCTRLMTKMNFFGKAKLIDWELFMNDKEKHAKDKNLSML
jgi:5'-3' exonuclease